MRNARKPYPRDIENGKWLVEGRDQGGRFVRVIFLVDGDDSIYIIHAMPMTVRRRRSGR